MMKLLKKCLMPLAILLILMAIFFSLFRALTPLAKQYKATVEQHLSMLLGQPVTIHDMETSWYWFEPVLKLEDVVLSDQKSNVLKLNKLLVGINLFSSLWHWQIKPGVLYVEEVHLTLRQADDHWSVDGLNPAKQSMTFDSNSYLPIMSWVLSQEKIIVKQVSAEIHFRDGTLIPLQNINITALNSYGHYRVKGSGKLAQNIPTEFAIIADMQLNPDAFNQPTAHAYISLQHVVPAQWQGFVPNMPIKMKGGEGNLALWLDVIDGHLFALQSTVDLKRITWTQKGKQKWHKLQSLTANLAWKRTNNGWQFSGDRINLHLDKLLWPQNRLLLTYQSTDDRYQLFVKHVPLAGIIATDMTWPDNMRFILDWSPQGELHDTQVVVKANQLDYVLTRFSNLGWNSPKNMPSVRQISGVLHWQPNEGRLELDGEHTIIIPHGLPEIVFEQFNAAFDWKELSNGIRISMDRFVLSRPDFVLTAQGVLDEPLKPSANLRMTTQFSATNATRWLQYIPSKGLKPKLDNWLKQDLKRIDKVSGEMMINGPLADFPYDKKPGQFVINSYLSGVDLFITPRWPLTRDIEAHLQVNHRMLDVDINNALLKDILIDKLSLIINDVGLGHEALLIHTDVHAPAKQIRDYVYATPIGERFLKWKLLEVRDAVGLDLQLDVPLYPARDNVFVQGELSLDNNPLIFHYGLKQQIDIDKTSGVVQFDEKGIIASELQGAFGGDPIVMHIQSILKPKRQTEFNIEGSTSIRLLRQKFPLPILSLMDGHANVQGVFQLSSNPHDFDHLQITSSMDGVTIELPPPLGKKRYDIAPLTIDADFNAGKSKQLHLSYKDVQIDAKNVTQDDWALILLQNDVRADLHYEPSTHTISGNVNKLYLSDLGSLKNKMRPSNTGFAPKDIPNLNVTIDDFKLNNISAGEVSIKSTSTANKWNLDYCKIKTPEYLLTMQGAWERVNKKDTSNLEANLHLSDLGQALARWGIAPAVEAKRSDVTFKGGWPGAIHDFSLERITGDMQIVVRDGRMTHLDKATEEKLGLGKLLSILSLQTIPRRLKLDFTDLSKEGYSFDEFKGNFSLKDGVMNTQDSYIDGPVAFASMKGDLDLIKHLYDVDLRVSPYITASLPIVATIAGGPIVGIATWAASKLINKGMQQISAYTYKVSGPWSDPVVQQVQIYRKKSN
jgi:uncharacterized protein YhdP